MWQCLSKLVNFNENSKIKKCNDILHARHIYHMLDWDHYIICLTFPLRTPFPFYIFNCVNAFICNVSLYFMQCYCSHITDCSVLPLLHCSVTQIGLIYVCTLLLSSRDAEHKYLYLYVWLLHVLLLCWR